MGNCGTKPKVLKDSDEGMIPVDRETTSFPVREVAAEKNASNDSNGAVETVDAVAVAAAAAAAARRSEKGKEIMIEVDDDVEVSKFDKRPSLSHLFQEDKAMEKEVIKQSPPKQEINNKTKSSPEISKSDSFLQKPSPEILEIHQKPTNDNIETSKLKSLDQDSEANKYSENWEVKFPEDLDVKDPKLSETTKVTEDSKLPKISEVKLPEEVKNIPEVSETESSDERLEVNDAKPEVVKVLESKDSDDLEDEVPELFEVKIPETSLEDNIVKDESEVKIVEDSKMEIDQEDVKGTKDKEIVSSEKEVTKDSSTVSDLGTK